MTMHVVEVQTHAAPVLLCWHADCRCEAYAPLQLLWQTSDGEAAAVQEATAAACNVQQEMQQTGLLQLDAAALPAELPLFPEGSGGPRPDRSSKPAPWERTPSSWSRTIGPKEFASAAGQGVFAANHEILVQAIWCLWLTGAVDRLLQQAQGQAQQQLAQQQTRSVQIEPHLAPQQTRSGQTEPHPAPQQTRSGETEPRPTPQQGTEQTLRLSLAEAAGLLAFWAGLGPDRQAAIRAEAARVPEHTAWLHHVRSKVPQPTPEQWAAWRAAHPIPPARTIAHAPPVGRLLQEACLQLAATMAETNPAATPVLPDNVSKMEADVEELHHAETHLRHEEEHHQLAQLRRLIREQACFMPLLQQLAAAQAVADADDRARVMDSIAAEAVLLVPSGYYALLDRLFKKIAASYGGAVAGGWRQDMMAFKAAHNLLRQQPRC